MGYQTVQPGYGTKIWALARSQHGVVTRTQLISCGVRPQAIKHRLARGRLHRTRWRGVYALGRPQLTRYGLLIAAVLACGKGAVLSHVSAAGLWELLARSRLAPIEVSVPATRNPRLAGIAVHRRAKLEPGDVTTLQGIPVTSPIRTLIDLARCVDPATGTRGGIVRRAGVRGPAPAITRDELEAAINAADRLDLVDPATLEDALGDRAGEPGVGVLHEVLDRRTFALTDSALERRFLRLVREAGVPLPLTQQHVNGHRVDFYWPRLGLVVETDGLRYHRTPAQQAADRERDQAHAAAGLATLRFTHAQVARDRERVVATLRAVARRLARGSQADRAAGD